MSGSLCYAYCVLPGTAAAPRATGVNDAPVSVLRGTDLSLAVSEVPLDEFEEQRLTRQLEDAEWTSRLAVTHFGVVEACFAAGPVLPLRICTIFRSPERARATLGAGAPDLQAALTRVTGSAQWSVKVRIAPGSTRNEDHATSGTDYLRRVAARRQDRAESLAAAHDSARRLHERLSQLAVASEQATAMDKDVVHSGSYLVRDNGVSRFLETTQSADLTGAGLAVDVRGPLAPYSFVPRLGAAA